MSKHPTITTSKSATDQVTCISPIDGSTYAVRPLLTTGAAQDALARAHNAQQAWQDRPLPARIELVRAGIARLGEMNDKIIPELAWQMGRPVRFGGEFGGVEERGNHMADIASEALDTLMIEDSTQAKRMITREPHGLVLVIAPWNYPFLTAVNTVVPALIAGNGVILKSASQTPLAGERLAQAFHQAGVPEDLFQHLFLDHQTIANLMASRAFDYINFTGSVAGGRAVERIAAGTFTPIGLELGGKDPGYVMADADLNIAAETLIDGAMFNSGQCCCGIERIYVAARRWDDFLAKALDITQNLVLGNPLDHDTTLGPMAHVRFAAHVREQIEKAVASGAVAHLPSLPADDGQAYLSPQILTRTSHDMAIMRDETFGPVVGLMKVRDDDEAVALMNDSPYGLTASLWTRDVERAQAIGRRLQTGTVFMNRADYLDPALCWTGRKDTGRGAALSVLGYHHLTQPKSYHLRLP
ncbi:MAG: aldehyde dehydrogenase family protein [Pseudomonadota bacterium]